MVMLCEYVQVVVRDQPPFACTSSTPYWIPQVRPLLHASAMEIDPEISLLMVVAPLRQLDTGVPMMKL